MSAGQYLVTVLGGVGSCVGFMLVLYNLVAGLLFLREATEGHSSMLARVSWVLGVLAVFLWFTPCVGAVVAIAAIVTSRIERNRIFKDEASLAGVTPVRMGSMNGSIVLFLQGVLFFGAIAGLLVH